MSLRSQVITLHSLPFSMLILIAVVVILGLKFLYFIESQNGDVRRDSEITWSNALLKQICLEAVFRNNSVFQFVPIAPRAVKMLEDVKLFCPSIDHWGTPLVTGLKPNLVPLTTTLWALPPSQLSIHASSAALLFASGLLHSGDCLSLKSEWSWSNHTSRETVCS